MSSIKKLVGALIFPLSAALCLGQRTPGTLSFSSEDERVANFVQLPLSVLTLLLNDKEDFPNGPPANLHCEDHEEAGLNYGQKFFAGS
jgi:hypothetical protein